MVWAVFGNDNNRLQEKKIPGFSSRTGAVLDEIKIAGPATLDTHNRILLLSKLRPRPYTHSAAKAPVARKNAGIDVVK